MAETTADQDIFALSAGGSFAVNDLVGNSSPPPSPGAEAMQQESENLDVAGAEPVEPVATSKANGKNTKAKTKAAPKGKAAPKEKTSRQKRKPAVKIETAPTGEVGDSDNDDDASDGPVTPEVKTPKSKAAAKKTPAKSKTPAKGKTAVASTPVQAGDENGNIDGEPLSDPVTPEVHVPKKKAAAKAKATPKVTKPKTPKKTDTATANGDASGDENAAEGSGSGAEAVAETPIKAKTTPKKRGAAAEVDGEPANKKAKSTPAKKEPTEAALAKKAAAAAAKAAKAKGPRKVNAMPECMAEFTEAELMMVRWKAEGKAWKEIEAEWERITTTAPGKDYCRKRYPGLAALAVEWKQEDEAKLGALIKKAENNIFAVVAGELNTEEDKKYTKEAVQKKWEMLKAAGVYNAKYEYTAPAVSPEVPQLVSESSASFNSLAGEVDTGSQDTGAISTGVETGAEADIEDAGEELGNETDL